MGTLECGAMVMKGYFDVFDRCIGAIEHIEGLLEKQDIPVELHVPDQIVLGITADREVRSHFHDPKGEMQADLGRAKEMVAEACQIAQNVLAEM